MKDESRRRVLVLGMGAYAYGRERRAVTMFGQMTRIEPYFIVPKYGDGSVPALLDRHGFRYRTAALGYLGRAHPVWTAITLVQVPVVYASIVRAGLAAGCRTVVVLNLHTLLHVLPAVLLLHRLGREIVLYLGDIPSDTPVHRWLGRRLNGVVRRAVANSQVVRKGLARIGVSPDATTVVYNGVEPRRFDGGRSGLLRRRLGWPDESFVAGYVGQVREDKGIGDFVECAIRMTRSGVDCRFLVVGGEIAGDPFPRRLRGAFEELAGSGRLIRLDWTPEIQTIYSELDVLVVPSRYDDPAPNVVLEAMTAGVPVIGSRRGGIPELILDGGDGFLVPSGDPPAIAACIQRLMGDEDLRRQMGDRARERAGRCFDASRNARLVERLILGEGPPHDR